MLIKFRGTRGSTHVKNKLHKKRTGTIVIIGKVKLYIDCGFSRKHGSNSAIILTKMQSSAKSLLDNKFANVYTTKSIARELDLKVMREFVCGHKINILGIDVYPIRTIYKLDCDGIGLIIDNVFIGHRIKKVPNLKYWLADVKYYIGDGSSFESITSQIKRIRNSSIRVKCWFTNCGPDVIHNHKNYSNLIDYNGIICHDGLIISAS